MGFNCQEQRIQVNQSTETELQSKCNLILGSKWSITCPAFWRLGRVTSSLKLVDPALHQTTPCRVHDKRLVDPPAVVSWANFQAQAAASIFADHFLFLCF